MENLSATLQEELNTEVVFSIGPLDFDETVVVTWIIMAVCAIGFWLLTRNLKVTNISRRQAAVEYAVTWLENMLKDQVGEGAAPYVPYLFTVLVYLAVANIIGVFGFKPPTKSLNVTAMMAIMSIILVQIAHIRAHGALKWLKSFGNPINILDLLTRPLSLCMRLFGNVLGAFVVMKLLEAVVPAILPAIFSLYFDFFDGILQAYVFVFLTGLYLKEATE